ncbi:MAG: SDR family NAD(P)-dependent oxidoreductase [Steroidobacteraceae bacterium]
MSALQGKVALITGAGQGLGFGIAKAFAAAGAKLAITGRDAAKLERAAAALHNLGADPLILPGDVRQRSTANDNVAATVARFGQLDVLVNNAQSTVSGLPLESIDDATVALTLESGLLGSLYHMQAAFPHMKGRGGSIINFASRTGIAGEAGFGIYAATKEGIRGLSRVASREWGPHNIRVNVISPAALTEAAAQYLKDNPEQEKYYLGMIPLRRLGDPVTDIGPVVVFLASDEARYVTGQTINAEGGMTMF